MPAVEVLAHSALVRNIAAELRHPEAEIKVVLALFSTVVAEALRNDRIVKVDGFGTFKPRRPKTGCRNPRTGERVAPSGRKSACFKAAHRFKATLNKVS